MWRGHMQPSKTNTCFKPDQMNKDADATNTERAAVDSLMPWRDPIIWTAPSKLLASNSFEIWQRQIQMYNFTPEIQSSQPGWEHSACSLCTCQACDSVWSPFRPMDGFPTHKRLSSPSISQRLTCPMLGTICCWKKSSLVSQPDALDSCRLLLWEAGPLRICLAYLHDTTKG